MSKKNNSFMLMGSPGSGKTYATASLADIPGKKVFYIMLENSIDVLKDAFIKRQGKVPENVMWHEFSMQGEGLELTLEKAEAELALSEEAKQTWRSKIKRKDTDYVRFIRMMANLVDDRTGTVLGNVQKLSRDHIVVLDSFTPFCEMIYDHYYGHRIAVDPKEIAEPQGAMINWLQILCWSMQADFVLCNHVEERLKDRDQAKLKTRDQEYKLFPSSIGQKYKDKLAGYFTACILSKRMGPKWVWDTMTSSADVKVRAAVLPLQSNNEPSFVPIYKAIEGLEK